MTNEQGGAGSGNRDEKPQTSLAFFPNRAYLRLILTL
ncbi:MAG: hypothetical protein JWQ16_3275 [Novosphingobium sp.]|nr:hypothetical protein [Novosphingobium sp.]